MTFVIHRDGNDSLPRRRADDEIAAALRHAGYIAQRELRKIDRSIE
jgi:hypothetical protein